MSIWVTYECDGNLNGKSCRRGVMVRSEDLEEVRRDMARHGFRPLTDVLSADTHYMAPGEHLCSRTDHDEEQPGYGPEDWVRLSPAFLKPGDVYE
jgi:hypothetical protein